MLEARWVAKAGGEWRRVERGGGAGARERPREPGGAGERVPRPCLRCLPSLWVFGERIPTQGTTADAELTRNGLIESVGNIDRCPVLAARPYSTARAGRIPRSPPLDQPRPCQLVPMQILMLLIAGGRTRESAVSAFCGCSFINCALKPERREGGG